MLESLIRMIQAFTPGQLQDAALIFLTLRGFRHPEVCDGWNDGGADLRVFQCQEARGRLVVQASVERRWQSKLETDLKKSCKNYEVYSYLYVTTRRIPELDWQRLHDRLRRETNVAIERADAQSLASAFWEAGRTSDLLAIAGIDQHILKDDSRTETSFLSEACFGYTFFSPAVLEFRQGILGQAIMTYVSQHPQLGSVDILAGQLAGELGLAETQVIQIQSTIDRLLQEGHLLITDNSIRLSSAAEDRVHSVETLSISAWHDLRLQLENQLQQHFGARAKEAASSILPYLGAIASSTGKITAGAFGRKGRRGRFDDHIRQRLLEIDAQLIALGVDDTSDRQTILEKLLKSITVSPVGRSLVAAELFIYLSGLSPSLLSQAFGTSDVEPTLVIDSNVAMPILANLYHGQAPGQFSRCAVQLYNTIRTHKLVLGIPLVYLEEMASHLVKAAQEYFPIVDADLDLRLSGNAWVAHYVSLRTSGYTISFQKYLNSLGATNEVVSRPFGNAKRTLMGTIRQLLERYGITVWITAQPNKNLIRAAETDLAWASQELNRPRLRRTELHDATVLACMRQVASQEQTPSILCTWDRVILEVTGQMSESWTALDPPTLVDLLSLTTPDTSPPPAMNALSIAMSLNEELSQKGADIVDWLVRHLGSSMADSELRSQALEFKNNYLKRSMDTRERILAEAWTAWREG